MAEYEAVATAARAIHDGLRSAGLHVERGDVAALAEPGGQLLFSLDRLLLRATHDRLRLLFDVACSEAPNEWYLFTEVRDELLDAPLSDVVEPTPADVVAFFARSRAEISEAFDVSNWHAMRRRLLERQLKMNAFMVRVLKGSHGRPR